MPQVHPEIVEKIEVFVLSDAISHQFPRAYVISSNTNKNEKLSYALVFFEENIAAFRFKNTLE